MLLTIVATANHYILDAFIGALVVLAAWKTNAVLLHLRPIERWLLWACYTTKPPPSPGRGPYALVDGEGELAWKANPHIV